MILESGRSGYKYKGVTYPRVTTIKGMIGGGEGLLNWAAGCVAEKVQELVTLHVEGKIGLAELLISLQDERLAKAHTDKRDIKADYGSLFHDLAESCAKGIKYDIPDHLLPAAEAFLEWLGREKVEYLWAETVMVSPTHGYAGKCDAFVKVRGRTIVLDYKTSKNIYPEFALQLAAYRYADFIAFPDGNEAAVPKCDGAGILHVTEAGVELVEVEASEHQFQAFLACKRLYDWRKSQPKPKPFPVSSELLESVFA